MQKNKLLLAALASAFALPVYAADAPAPAGPTLSSVLDASGISVSGDIDTSYNVLSGTGKFVAPSTANSRVFDYAHNSFSVQGVDLTVAKQPAEGAGGLIDVTLGKDSSTIASYGTATAVSPAAQTQTYDLTQAFVQYASGATTVIAGKFATLAGQEVIKASGNTNYSRSILFGYAIPFTHTGARVTYKASDAVSVIAGVNNGWDQATDTNSNKTVELGVALNPSKSFALTAQGYFGAETGNTGVQGMRNLIDLVATFTVSDALNFVLNYDTGSQKDAVAVGSTAKWSGLAAYANYQINDPWRVSFRVESFKDDNGYRTGIAQTWKEATLTVGYAAAKNLELRGEVRKDNSNVASFAYSDAIPRKTQNSLGLEAVYKF